MDCTLNIPQTDDVETLCSESERLRIQNAELRTLMGLLHENAELRITVKEHEKKIRNLSPRGRSQKDAKDKENTVLEAEPCPNIKEEEQTTSPRPQLDPEKVKQCKRVVGEIAFQLDRRILCTIFLEQHRLYGYRVANIQEKIIQVTTCPLSGKINDQLRSELNRRYQHTMDQLKELGYDPKVHAYFTEHLVNSYGILKDRTTTEKEHMSTMNDPEFLKKMITEYMLSDKVENILIILNCLTYLARQNGNSMFLW